jgi:hypothetical protein
MTDLDILSVLNYRLVEFLDVHPISVSYPNIKFTPQQGVPYIKVDFLPAETVAAAVGGDAKTRHVGIYQLMLVLPKYKSFLEAKDIVDDLKSFFRMSTAITYNGVSLRVTKFQVNPYKEDKDWFYQPVSVYYRTDLEND